MKKIINLSLFFFVFLVVSAIFFSFPKSTSAILCPPDDHYCPASRCVGCTFQPFDHCGTSGCFWGTGYLSNTCGAGCVPTATPVPTAAPTTVPTPGGISCTCYGCSGDTCVSQTVTGSCASNSLSTSCPSCGGPPPPPPTYSISGRVYIDSNSNRTQDTGEVAYDKGTTVALSTETFAYGTTTSSTDPDPDQTGKYYFNNVSPYSFSGSSPYTVTLTVPTGYTVTTTNPAETFIPPSNTVDFGIKLSTIYSISGNVFVDQNKDGVQNGGDSNYTGGITISPNPPGATVTYPSAGNYVINNMSAGQYIISYTSLPSGYTMTNPLNGPPPSFSVTVGPGCDVTGSNSASCDLSGNITGLRYGITNSIPWIQSTSGDITGVNVTNPSGGGITNPIPSGATCGTYTSLVGTGGTPGVIYAGAGSYSFGSGQASQDPPYGWVVGGTTYPDTYIPTTPGLIKTSYSYMLSQASPSNLTPVNIASYCGGGGIASCTLSTSLPNGLYISNGDLTLTGASYIFPANKNFVILVDGKLNIQTGIQVPIGSTAFFTAKSDINVSSSVGNADYRQTCNPITHEGCNLEGYYSTDGSFYVQSLDATGKGLNCPVADKRLNVAGSIVVNAALKGGSFVNQRDLCAGNSECPAFMIVERPDFVLNSPEFLKSPRRIWQEIAP